MGAAAIGNPINAMAPIMSSQKVRGLGHSEPNYRLGDPRTIAASATDDVDDCRPRPVEK